MCAGACNCSAPVLFVEGVYDNQRNGSEGSGFWSRAPRGSTLAVPSHTPEEHSPPLPSQLDQLQEGDASNAWAGGKNKEDICIVVSDTEPELNPWSNGDAVCVEEEWVATFSGQTGDQPEENTPHLSSSKGQLENFKPNSLGNLGDTLSLHPLLLFKFRFSRKLRYERNVARPLKDSFVNQSPCISYSVATAAARFQALEHNFTNTSKYYKLQFSTRYAFSKI